MINTDKKADNVLDDILNSHSTKNIPNRQRFTGIPK